MQAPVPPDRGKMFVDAWRSAGPVLEQDRIRRIRQTDTPQAVRNLGWLTAKAVRDKTPTTESGLSELQHWFMIARQRQLDRAGQ
ncbi:MAG: hypothetical protein AAF288_07730 [Planctomycetota bacterium]